MTMNMPTAGPGRDTFNGQFTANRLGEQTGAAATLGRDVGEFPKPSPQYRSLNNVPPALLENTPAPLASQTFRDGRPIGDRISFASSFDERFRVLDSYESLFGPYERSSRHLNSRNLLMAGVDPVAVAEQVDLRHTELHATLDNDVRVRAWIGVNPEESGMRLPPSAEYPIGDQRLGQLAMKFDSHDLHHFHQLRAQMAGGHVAPWSILSPTAEQVSYIDERTSQATTAATTTGIAHTRLIQIQEALERIRNNRPLAGDWKLDVGMNIVSERQRQISALEAVKNKRVGSVGMEMRQLVDEEQAMWEVFQETSRKLRDLLGLEEMRARDQMQKMIEANDEYQHYTWESGYPGAYGSAPRLPRAPRSL